ncbi:MAG: xanthine dehydrogenase family protein molybdopterin-binding subunit [Clostridiales bacterium]|nr:xanthine dehydrogenase family protein molybdopterin-binding subunit [Clostridiales bacterium]
MSKMEYRYVGKNVERIEAKEIVTGKTIYLDDFKMKDMLYVKSLKCPYPSAKITKIDISKAQAYPGVTAVLYYGNMPRICETWGISAPPDIPVLHDYGCYVGDTVALVSAERPEIAERALDLIEIEYEQRTPVLTVEEAIEPDAPLVHPDYYDSNICPVVPIVGEDMMMHLKRGNPDAAFEECDYIDESDAQYNSIGSPMAVESPVVVWQYDVHKNSMKAWASSQTPHGYRVNAQLVQNGMENETTIFNVGGGFGNKAPMTLPTQWAAIMAVANPGRPCKYVMTKTEQQIAFDERIGMYMRFKVGMKDGLIHAVKGEVYLNCGAYNTCGQWQMGVGLGEAQIGCGKCKNWDLDGKMVFTNHVQTGPVRGFGGQEIRCAMVPVIMRLVRKAGIDPVDFMAKNFAQTGDGWFWRNQEWYDCREQDYAPVTYETAERFGWKDKWKGWLKPTKIVGNKAYGVGVANHGNADVGEDNCVAYVRLDAATGMAYLYQDAAEQGCGQRSNARKIAAEVLDMEVEKVIVVLQNTESTGYGQGPAGSRGTITTLTAVTRAAEDARMQLLQLAAEKLHASPYDLETKDGMIFYKNRPEQKWPWVALTPFGCNILGEGKYYADYSKSNYCVYFAEVVVYLETGETRLVDVAVGSDVGQVIDPATLEMQFHGGFGAAAADTGLMEENVLDRSTGRVMTGNLIDYKWRTFNDFPPIEVVIQESLPEISRWKAVGLGEISGAPGPAAMMMAISNAIGVDYCEYPASREGILKALGKL